MRDAKAPRDSWGDMERDSSECLAASAAEVSERTNRVCSASRSPQTSGGREPRDAASRNQVRAFPDNTDVMASRTSGVRGAVEAPHLGAEASGEGRAKSEGTRDFWRRNRTSWNVNESKSWAFVSPPEKTGGGMTESRMTVAGRVKGGGADALRACAKAAERAAMFESRVGGGGTLAARDSGEPPRDFNPEVAAGGARPRVTRGLGGGATRPAAMAAVTAGCVRRSAGATRSSWGSVAGAGSSFIGMRVEVGEDIRTGR